MERSLIIKFIEIDGRRWVDVLATQETWGENLNRLNDSVDAGPNVQKIYSEAKAKTQIFESKLKELEYQQTIGKLVNADEVKKEIINMSRTVRDAYLSLPARVAPLLAPITDPLEIDRILSEEIHKILENLVNANNR